MNNNGIPIRSNLDDTQTHQYAALVTQLAAKARSTVRDLDPTVSFHLPFWEIFLQIC